MNHSRFDRRYRRLRATMGRYLRTQVKDQEPKEFADALGYVLGANGKRVRSTILLLSCQAVGGRVADAMHAGAAMEMMHNFTLVHDDIMDHASTRRGRPTVHTRWDANVGLLTGDVMLGMAYRSLLRTKTTRLTQVIGLFTEGLLGVCNGQALDIGFERRSRVSLRDYSAMIEKKTGALLAASSAMGGVIGGATTEQVRSLYRFGLYLGRAFQVQDDLLDVVAEQKEFGKRIGGDIIERKKTFLLLTAMERASQRDRKSLQRLYSRPIHRHVIQSRIISEVTDIYIRNGIIDAARKQIALDTRRAQLMLQRIPVNDGSAMLRWFSNLLLHRIS